jgi:hypothetical protein
VYCTSLSFTLALRLALRGQLRPLGSIRFRKCFCLISPSEHLSVSGEREREREREKMRLRKEKTKKKNLVR